MRSFYIIGFLILLCFDTFAQTSFKIAADRTAPAAFDVAWIVRLLTERWIYFAVASYLGAFVTYMTLLKRAPIGPAFAATHMEIITVLIVSFLFLGEKLTGVQICGGVLIMSGIFLLGTEKETDTAPEAKPEEVPSPVSDAV